MAQGGASVFLQQTFAEQGPPAQGIRRMSGTVFVNGKAAKKSDPVAAGDIVSTGPHSYAVFVVGEDAFLARGDSKVELGGSALLVNALRLVSGKLLSVFAPHQGNRTIQSATATIGIRGTGAYMEAEPDRSYFCLCYGEAEIIPIARPAAKVLLRTTHHDSPRYILGGGATENPIQDAKIENHQDAELILLESLVGREPPFMQRSDNKRD